MLIKSIEKVRVIAGIAAVIFCLPFIGLSGNPENDSLTSGNGPVFLPELGVHITPPAHFVKSNEFNGFIHLGSSSTILVTKEEDIPFMLFKTKEIQQSFSDQGIEVRGVEEIKGENGKKGLLYKLAFTVEEITFIRLLYITGNYHETYILNGNYPEMAEELLYDPILQSLLSIDYSKE